MDVKALIFDIGGTVFDWNTAIIEALGRHRCYRSADPEAFALACRAGFLDTGARVVRGDLPWMTSDAIFARTADEVCGVFGLAPDASAREDLAHAWRRMPAWPGARAAIAALRTRYVVMPLTILSLPMAVGSSRRCGIDWDGMLCCDVIGVYKPDPRCYARAAEILDLRAAEIAMVAAHPSDLRAAAGAGYKTVYVMPRLEDPGEDYSDSGFRQEFDLVAADFDELARLL